MGASQCFGCGFEACVGLQVNCAEIFSFLQVPLGKLERVNEVGDVNSFFYILGPDICFLIQLALRILQEDKNVLELLFRQYHCLLRYHWAQ